MSNYGNIEIQQAGNGYIIKTSYFCFGGEQTKVFETWGSAQEFVRMALRIPAKDSTDGSANG